MPRIGRRTAMTGLVAAALLRPALAEPPKFQVDPSWPKPLPNNWILGQVGGITVDAQGHIWVIHRPRSLDRREKARADRPARKCCVSAPPVLEFDADGNVVRAWGGPAKAMNGRHASTASTSMTTASSGSAAMPTTTTRC